ncbi:sigma-70 family RNA polymerase sigma factor [Promicromonospora iranensis]|uniref:RNA polymerase sigma-70 factor (ECF subfamily) n=1 Tax=Promicromonospora iranensis TaxID=1105144 RepID=A0ABU2CH86_9MICO|nr:sigma-70 family RNA polymerase sigma factor [Promicromonospora iranensis]MDR7380696.1 RNA polymerase sigma-70 factor (ECF subfamily) [Promicromonospora iranensis]
MTDPEVSHDGSVQDGDAQLGGARLDGAALDRLRPLAFTVAYRMLGSVAEAEDVVQEALMRLSQADGVRNPDAFVTTVTTRIAIDVLRSARVRRESYVGEWLPEPLVGPVPSNLPVAMAAQPPDAAAHAVLADDLSTAFLVLLETLTATERAAFLLHDVLGFPHSDAAEVIGTSEVAARQLASRARRRIARQRGDVVQDGGDVGPVAPARRTASTADTEAPDGAAASAAPGRARRARADELVTRFLAACEEGAVDSFLELLAEDVVLTGDSGGNVPRGMSIARPVTGRDAIARLLAGFMRRGAPVHFERALVGGEPGLLIMADDVVGGGLIGTWSFEMSFDVPDGRLAGVRGVINPEKLRHLGPLADLDRLQAWLRNARPRRGAR